MDWLLRDRGCHFPFFFLFSLLEMYLVEAFQWDGRVDARDARGNGLLCWRFRDRVL